MRRNLAKFLCISLLGAWAGYAGPWQTASAPLPPAETQVELGFDLPEAPEPAVTPPHALQSAQDAAQWGVAALDPRFAVSSAPTARPSEVSLLSRILALTTPGLAMAAPPPPLGNVPNYPVQRPLKVSWTLQGMADDMAEGGEGADVVEYGG